MINYPNYFSSYFENFKKLFNEIDQKRLENLYLALKKVEKEKSKILIFGNGAGASISSHFANDLANTKKIKALSFDNSAHLTCFSNDYGYENWVKKTIEIFAVKKDLVILISASGNSKNMINAAKYCKKKKIIYYPITGFNKNNSLNKLSKNYIWVNSNSYNKVEAMQLLILLSMVDKLNLK